MLRDKKEYNIDDSETTTEQVVDKHIPHNPNIFYRLTVISCGAFIVTILAVMASAIGDQRAPIVKLLDRIGSQMLTIEVVLTFSLAILGMRADKGAGRRNQRNEQVVEQLGDAQAESNENDSAASSPQEPA